MVRLKAFFREEYQMNSFNLSALAVKERAVTLFLLIAIAAAACSRLANSGVRKIRPSW